MLFQATHFNAQVWVRGSYTIVRQHVDEPWQQICKSVCMAPIVSVQPLKVLHGVQVQKEAIQAVEQDGMVFIDEIDKIVTSTDSRYGMLCTYLAVQGC